MAVVHFLVPASTRVFPKVGRSWNGVLGPTHEGYAGHGGTATPWAWAWGGRDMNQSLRSPVMTHLIIQGRWWIMTVR